MISNGSASGNLTKDNTAHRHTFSTLCLKWLRHDRKNWALYTKRSDVLPPNPSLEAARWDIAMILSLWNLTGLSIFKVEKSKPQSHGFETSRDLVVRRPSAYRIEALEAAIVAFLYKDVPRISEFGVWIRNKIHTKMWRSYTPLIGNK